MCVKENYNKIVQHIKSLSRYESRESNYGTIIIDIEDLGNIFSLEIGKDSIGYFSEFKGNTLHFEENLLLNDDKTIEKLKYDYNEYKMFIGYA